MQRSGRPDVRLSTSYGMPTGALYVFSNMLMRLYLDEPIFTGDKDLMSLVDEHVNVVDTMRDVSYDPARVEEKFGVPAAQVISWLALRGDSIDNVPGVSGIGDVTATKLLREHGSIE